MTNNSSQAANQLQAKCETELNLLLKRHTSIFFISLASVDGRAYAHAQRQVQSDSQRIAAMTSSLLGLSETYAKEVGQARCRYSIIALENGSIITVRIPSKSLRFALSIGADESESIGTILRAALDAADSLAAILS